MSVTCMLETCLEKLRYNRDGSWLEETFRSALADDPRHQREVLQDCAVLFKSARHAYSVCDRHNRDNRYPPPTVVCHGQRETSTLHFVTSMYTVSVHLPGVWPLRHSHNSDFFDGGFTTPSTNYSPTQSSRRRKHHASEV